VTTDRDIAPLVRSWLRDEPDDSAEHVLDRALAIVDTTPQRSAARWPARSIDMNLIVRLGVAAAVLAVSAAVGLSIFRNIGSEETNPSPPASTTADEGSPGTALPDELAFRWIAEPRPVAGIETGDRLLVDLDSRVFSVTTGTQATSLVSSAAIDDAGRLRLETVADETGCELGDVGTYEYSLSPAETVLTVSPVSADACAGRSDAFSGEWRRSACRAAGLPCLGLMEAGNQSTLLFDPFREDPNPPTARYGAMTYTVPDGWANADDRTHLYTILRGSDYAESDPANCLDCPDGLWIGAQPRASLDCSNSPDAGVGTSVEALAAWIRAHPGLDVTEGDVVSVDGRPTIVLDIAAPESADACAFPEDDATGVTLFTHVGYDYGIRTGDRHRLLLVEIDADSAMLIGIDSFDPDDLEALIEETRPIVESIRLSAP
jgi:hypothetical protein